MVNSGFDNRAVRASHRPHRHNCHARLDLTDLAVAIAKFLQSARGGVGTRAVAGRQLEKFDGPRTAKKFVSGPVDRLARPLHYTVSVPAATGNRQDRYGRLSPESSPYKWWTTGHNGCSAATDLVAENRHNAFDFTAQPRALLPPCWADQSGQPVQEDGIEV